MRRVPAMRVALALMGGVLASASQAQEQPSAAMMEPVHGLVSFMSTLRRGVCIIENFAPYLFCGLQAAANWAAGFRTHAAADDLKDLNATFAAAHDFSQTGKRVYILVADDVDRPDTWQTFRGAGGLVFRARTRGRPLANRGIWLGSDCSVGDATLDT